MLQTLLRHPPHFFATPVSAGRRIPDTARILSLVFALFFINGGPTFTLGATRALAAGQDGASDPQLSVEVDGQRYALLRPLSGDEIRELVSDHTLVFLHPDGEELEFHFANGQTLNGWSRSASANAGLWQIKTDEICWSYPGGTHCKTIWTTERENLYAQVPGWYDGPLAFWWEPGDSRALQDRPEEGDAI